MSIRLLEPAQMELDDAIAWYAEQAPGLGDDIQAIKAGILEIADILVVNKADRPGVDKTIQALEMMLETDANNARQIRHHDRLLSVQMPARQEEMATRWPVKVMKTVAANGDGVEELRQRIEEHRAWLHESGEINVREQVRIAHTLESIIQAELNRRIKAHLPTEKLNGVVEAVRLRQGLTRAPAFIRRLVAKWMARNPFVLREFHGTLGLTSIQAQGFNRPLFAIAPNIFTFTLAVGAITERVCQNAAGEYMSRKILCLSAGADHLIIDGAPLARFAQCLIEQIESAAGLDAHFIQESQALINGQTV